MAAINHPLGGQRRPLGVPAIGSSAEPAPDLASLQAQLAEATARAVNENSDA